MKKPCLLFLPLLFLCVPARFVFSQDEEPPDLNETVPDGAERTIKHALTGGAETLFANGIIMAFNISNYKITGKYPWAIPNADSIRQNLTTPWEWEDDDGFIVNQMGHPYQGSIYYNAGRANGFGFYESAFFSALGSSTWEAFGESNLASINDFITTVTGSFSVGEMLYRLYLEAYAASFPAPLAFFINPMAGFHRLLTGWEPPDYGRNLYSFQVHLGAGYAQTHYSVSGGGELFSFRGPFAEPGFLAVYGNPFEQESRVPFNHFELALSTGLSLDMSYMTFRLVSDGYLFSFSPIYDDKNMMSTGLTLHLDSIALGKLGWKERGASTINQYSNALDWTIKYRHVFSDNASFQAKFHTGFTFLGVSQYYSPETKEDLLNYGGGFNGKLYFTFDHKKLGRLDADVLGYALWSYPGTSAVSRGTVFWLFAGASYSYPVSKHFFVGLADSFALEHGTFCGFPDTRKYNNAVKMFMAWNL